MYAMIGTVHNELSAFDPRHAAIAIPAFDQALALWVPKIPSMAVTCHFSTR